MKSIIFILLKFIFKKNSVTRLVGGYPKSFRDKVGAG